MGVIEIIESGLLELYVIGELNQYDVQIVEAAIKEESNLKQIVKEIEAALHLYAKANAHVTHSKVLDIIQGKIRDKHIIDSKTLLSNKHLSRNKGVRQNSNKSMGKR